MSTKANNSKSILGIVLILALLALNAYQWMVNSNLKSDLNENKTAYNELEKLNTELDQDYEDALKDLEDMRSDNQELNALIDAQKAELGEQKERISGLIWTKKELGKAREELDKFQALADQYVAEINTLKEENMKLTERTSTLENEVAVSQMRIGRLDSVKTVLSSMTEKLNTENEALSSKVDMAEAIKINYMEMTGYDVKDDGKLKEKNRAKKVEMLRTCFTTETNLVTPAGEKKFYIKYIAPTGEVLYVEELGSGKITNKLTNEKVMYTASGVVDYNNEDLTACLDWKPNFELQSGIYKVEIYNNGFNVGNGEFRLK